MNKLLRLEQYTLKRPQELLLVRAIVDDELDEVAIFKGFSSSLTRSTASNPDVPMLPDTARIIEIDRLYSPYNPDAPHYIQQGLTWAEIEPLLIQVEV
ncbi:hypothetical protein JOY44_11570 [Phormidium sp. CLA17]|uniref:DUF7734 family protein n=1 Tax=Leptolyngbya sp. Cla-17 TaxID=2803751 RepID=UPI001491F8D4|nr:hypothetical protein [Leptolyngbya sp. Cla-17]MBM0742250.1 hypothetical protein [Leptolyngbya sp. Cla-17]